MSGAPTPLSLPTAPGWWWMRVTGHYPRRRGGPIESTLYDWCAVEVTEHQGQLYDNSDTYMGPYLIEERREGSAKGSYFTFEWVGPLTPPSIP